MSLDRAETGRVVGEELMKLAGCTHEEPGIHAYGEKLRQVPDHVIVRDSERLKAAEVSGLFLF